MLWFGISIMDVEDSSVSSQEMYGPYEDVDLMTTAIDDRVEEATKENQVAVAIPFELCTDDVPEIVSMG